MGAEKAFQSLKAPVKRIACADCPAPVSKPLEDAFFPSAATITAAALDLMGLDGPAIHENTMIPDDFTGPY